MIIFFTFFPTNFSKQINDKETKAKFRKFASVSTNRRLETPDSLSLIKQLTSREARNQMNETGKHRLKVIFSLLIQTSYSK